MAITGLFRRPRIAVGKNLFAVARSPAHQTYDRLKPRVEHARHSPQANAKCSDEAAYRIFLRRRTSSFLLPIG